MSSHGRKRARELSGVPFIRALILFMRSPPSYPSYLPEAPPPNTITIRVRISAYEFGGNTNFLFIAKCILRSTVSVNEWYSRQSAGLTSYFSYHQTHSHFVQLSAFQSFRAVLLKVQCAYELSEDIARMQILIQQGWGQA